MARTDVHFMPVDEVVTNFQTNLDDGLTTEECRRRIEISGLNKLPPPRGSPVLRELWRSFTDLFSVLLQVAAILCAMAYLLNRREISNLYLFVFLYLVVFVTCIFSFVQKYRSDQTLREFSNFLPHKTTVVRDGGRVQLIPSAELVQGDVVRIKLGDKVPADIRLTSVSGMRVDKSALSGESEPVSLTVVPSKPDGAELDATNVAFFGTLVVDGTAEGIVYETGPNTVFGRIVKLTIDGGDTKSKTTLQADMHHFVIVTALFSLGIGIAFFICGVLNQTRLIHNLVYSIGMFVSNIPEGLIATVTVALTFAARRMAAKNVLVKRLDAIEALGSATVICSDKTGTITRNRMRVAGIYFYGHHEIIDELWTPPSAEEKLNSNWETLKFCAVTCSTAFFDGNESPGDIDTIEDRVVFGDASEAGLLRFCERAITHENNPLKSVRDMRKKFVQEATIPFNSSQKYMVTVNRNGEMDGQSLTVTMKGAPERVLDRCTQYLTEDGANEEFTDEIKANLITTVDNLASTGERVLAFARLVLTPGQSQRLLESATDGNIDREEIPHTDLVFVGLVSLKDPPRHGVDLAVQKVRNAGLRVMMVTGDHPGTAQSIAAQVGIVTLPYEEFIFEEAPEDESDDETRAEKLSKEEENIPRTDKSTCIIGAQIPKLGQEDWRRLLSYEEIVFARTSPEQKLVIVKELQRRGEVVGVTGDGVNDAPALKQAEIGIAMGLSGTEVSKEASDIVLLDDNFASIVNGVEEGRLVFDNLKKSIAYSLTSNVPQLVPFLSFVLFHIPVPLTTILVLSIDLGTDIFPAIALAYEKPESDLMQRPPRDIKTDKLLSNQLLSYATVQLGLIQTMAGFASYFFAMQLNSLSPFQLIGLDRLGRFSGAHVMDERWLYNVRGNSPVISGAGWFSEDNNVFSSYFNKSGTPVSFKLQENATFSQMKQPVTGTTPAQAPFNYMVKAVAQETALAPCQTYSCTIGGSLVRNNRGCFDTKRNPGPVQLDKPANRNLMDNSANGSCFTLWTPADTKDVLRYSQTSYFAAIVVAQAFTVFACKTRINSLLKHGLWNLSIILAVILEFLVAFVIIYTPQLRTGFQVRPLQFINWIPALPFGKLIITYDECRKFLIRRDLHPVPIVDENGEVVADTRWLTRIARWVREKTLW